MGANTGIEWTDHTWNPWRGCTKVSAGCKYCYMFREQWRYGRDPEVVERAKEPTFRFPMSKKVKAGDKIFVCSWSDFFHKEADDWRAYAWDIIRQRPDVTFQIVTKRPERMWACLPDDWGEGWPHVWLLVSAENQKAADDRIPILLQTPAAVRGVSYEPALGPMDFTHMDATSTSDPGYNALYCGPDDEGDLRTSIDWVICGGESGPKARPMHPDWARSARDQCEAAGVAFFFKQWGEYIEVDPMAPIFTEGRIQFVDGTLLRRVGKVKAGAMLDGKEYREFPRTREGVEL